MSPWPDTVAPASLRVRLRRRFAPPTIVLLYHRVVPDIERDANQLATHADNFAAHLSWLSAHARPLRPVDFLRSVAHPARSKLALDGGKPRVLITFDDGYADNFHHALPILEHRGLSAILFATTGQIGSDEPFWWDALEEIVFAGTPPTGGWRLLDGTLVPNHGDKVSTYQVVHEVIKSLGSGARRDALADLARQARLRPRATEDSRPMTWEELRAWVDAGLAVGGHSRTHPQLSALSTAELREEIPLCKNDLEQRLAVPIDTFAYPYGSVDTFDERCEQAVRDAGFRCAFANRTGNARWARSAYAVPRCLVRDWSGDEFAARFEEWCR